MTEALDFSGIQATAVKRMKARKIVPVPHVIVALAQKAYDGVPDADDPDTLLHNLQHEFESEERAKAFADHMKNAGDHTKPISSVTVVIDPDETGNKKLVRWRAGNRRGRQVA